MSTLPGLASKGEKAKPKFQSLDINRLYSVSRGENLEKQQQKNTLTYKHGMQSLGKVPNARRAPANLPSLKSEHSGSDASVPLVPPGGPGWGKQESTSTSSTSPTVTTTTITTPTVNSQPAPPQLSSHQAAIALPVTTTIPPPNKHVTPSPSTVTPVNTTDKSWSAIMSGTEPIHPPLYQSPQFQHEFPSLSVGDGGPTRTGSEAQYTPGLSLRPQTEGSWIQGGSCPGMDGPPRSNSVPLGVPPQLAGQVGLPQQQQQQQQQHHQIPLQFRSVMPNFMYKGNFSPPNGNGISTQNAPLPPSVMNGRNNRQENNRPLLPPRMVDSEEIMPRPIIKEEELIRMDEMDRDMGWTCHDDIDYNQKLAFSDDESGVEKNNTRSSKEIINNKQPLVSQKEQHVDNKVENTNEATQPRNWSTNNITNANNNINNNAAIKQQQQLQQQRSSEEEWKQRRNQHYKDIELTVQRAKQRKEEEEKRFNEATKQGAAKKLLELEEKMSKRGRDQEEGIGGTINPSVVPPKPIIPADIPLPDFQRDKERDTRSRTPNDSASSGGEEKSLAVATAATPSPSSSAAIVSASAAINNRGENSFRQLTQIEGKNFARKHVSNNNNNKGVVEKDSRDRDREIREQNGPSFSRHFQSHLPPRFQKQQRNNNSTNSSNVVPAVQQQMHFSSLQQFDNNRWMQQQQGNQKTSSTTSSIRQESPDRDGLVIDDRRASDYKRQSSSDESYRGGGSQQQQHHRSQNDLSSHKSHDNHHRYAAVAGSGVGEDAHDYNNHHQQQQRHQDYDYGRRNNNNKDDDKWQKDLVKTKHEYHGSEQQRSNSSSNDDWHVDRRIEKYRDDNKMSNFERYERPQRPDSRDSRASRDSRHSRDSTTTARDSESRDYIGSWAEPVFEPSPPPPQTLSSGYEEKRSRDHLVRGGDDRRQVPGPITKDRIEADDMRNEKRNLTQLMKRGGNNNNNLNLPDKKRDNQDKIHEGAGTNMEIENNNKKMMQQEDLTDLGTSSKAWADAVSSPSSTVVDSDNSKFPMDSGFDINNKANNNLVLVNKDSLLGKHFDVDSTATTKKSSDLLEMKDRDDKRNNRGGGGRIYPQNKGWGGSNNEYHRSNAQSHWSTTTTTTTKQHRVPTNVRGVRSGGPSHSTRSSVTASGGDYRATTTDSDSGSIDEINNAAADALMNKDGSQKTKTIRKVEKDEKNKEIIKHDNKPAIINTDRNKQQHQDSTSNKRDSGYVPRGEPSKHGRGGGGGNFRSRGGLSKRIDGYGPPPSKSPFGHHDDRDKIVSNNEIGDDRAKQNQQALSAGIIGSLRKESNYNNSNQFHQNNDRKFDHSRSLRKQPDNRRGKSRTKNESGQNKRDNDESNSDNNNSDDLSLKESSKSMRKPLTKQSVPAAQSSANLNNNQQQQQQMRRNNINNNTSQPPPPRLSDNNNKQRNYGAGGGSRPTDNSIMSRAPQTTAVAATTIKKDDNNKLLDDQQNSLCMAIADISLKNKDDDEKVLMVDDCCDEKLSLHGGDSDGFQEVKSKKMGKERQKQPMMLDDKITINKSMCKTDKDLLLIQNNKTDRSKIVNKNLVPNVQLSQQQQQQQQISTIPSLLPASAALSMSSSGIGGNKTQFERPRQNKLAPRFAKQRENSRLQKVQMQQQQQQNICDVTDMNKVNQNMTMYGINKDVSNATVTTITNAWDKSLGAQLRNIDGDNVLGVVSTETCKSMEHVQLSGSASQSNSPNTNDKLIAKTNQLQDSKAMLDGTTPPVNTIIFENTNFKSAPGSRTARPDTNNKPRSKLDDGTIMIDNNASSVVTTTGFNSKPIADLLLTSNNKNDNKQNTNDTIQLPLSFKEDNTDIKLDFFDSELTHLTEETKTTKNLCSMSSRTMHTISTGNSNSSTISTADALNFKIQSVKKMWETPADHNVVVGGQECDANTTFASSFVTDPSNSLDPHAFSKGNDTPDDDHHSHHHHQHHHHEGYSPSPNQVASNSTTNVCKVKPTQQVAGGVGAGGQPILTSTNHQQQQQQQHSGLVGPSLMGNPLSPPPLQTVIGAGVNIGQPPQQYTTNQHLGYQTSLGGSNQYGMSAIPSPPTVMYNSTQAGLYGPFQIDQTAVLGGQQRSQYSQYPNHYGLGQTASSPYSTQSVYLQTAQPHHPPTAQAPPPDLYQNMSNYRLSATGPFGQNQQLNNPTTVLISSTSNSLMSASVKPSSQQISAIGTKTGGVGQAYQQQSQQSQQVFMAYDPTMTANYLPNASVMQRGPAGPVQNNVVPALQPSSSYYSGSTGGQTGYFQQPPGNSSLQSAQMQQHQAGYGLQGNVFGAHNQSHTNAGLQSFNSHFLSTPMQLAAALTAQQYRTTGLPAQYMKGVNNQQQSIGGDQSGRSQQLKSPASQEVLSSVFNSGPQISSPKLRQGCKQPPSQPSPTAQHKYNLYQSVGNQQQSGNRYPTPIQRPVNFQQNLGSIQQNNNNQKHRVNNTVNNNNNTTKPPPSSSSSSRQYYGGQSNSLTSQNEKTDDTKLNDVVVSSSLGNAAVPSNSSAANAVVINSASTPNTSASVANNNKAVVIGSNSVGGSCSSSNNSGGGGGNNTAIVTAASEIIIASAAKDLSLSNNTLDDSSVLKD